MFHRPTTLCVELHRSFARSGRIQHYVFYTLAGPHLRANYVAPETVEPFHGLTAWYEVESTGAAPWPTWRALSQVPPPILSNAEILGRFF